MEGISDHTCFNFTPFIAQNFSTELHLVFNPVIQPNFKTRETKVPRVN